MSEKNTNQLMELTMAMIVDEATGKIMFGNDSDAALKKAREYVPDMSMAEWQRGGC